MNRKQKVAVVVGVVVIVLLVLFPPWVLEYRDAFDVPRPWRLTHGPAFILRPPRHPVDKARLTLLESKNLAQMTKADLREKMRLQARAELDWTLWLFHLAAALALTVAAVVVLKERKAKA